jgi:threonine dehydrogenase-like Zn-dependent dehydrogenase
LIPNLETALNAVWDGEVAPDERAVVLGGGPVGLLVAFVLSRLHPGSVTVAESDPDRRRFIDPLPWVDRVLEPEVLPDGDHAVAFHTSGSPAGLDLALRAVGFEGRVIELSWYGERKVTLDLGTDFHYRRKRIIASQVSTIAASRRATHGHRERLAEAMALAGDEALDRLLGPPVRFESMPAFMSELYRGNPVFPAPVIEYENDRRRG